jgi:CHAT domain-containing protein
MPKTPGLPNLAGVEREAELISSSCQGILKVEVHETPSTDMVLRRILDAQALHFACHGCVDTKDLSNSYLALCNTLPSASTASTDTSMIVDPLTVGSLVSLTARRLSGGPQLAYLSACSTAGAVVQNMADEAVHLAAGFLAAGFSHVVATLWDTQSDICVDVAEAFYTELCRRPVEETHLLTEDGEVGKAERHRKIRFTLHVAILKVRERRLRQPLSWAGFVQLGA